VSEQYEPSYYEIALTGRQVLVAFVILLICLVAAFFSGVWVGRGGSGRTGPVQAQMESPGQASGSEGAQTAGGAAVADQAGTGAGSAGAAPGGSTAEKPSVPEQEGVDALSFFDQEVQGGKTPSGDSSSGGGQAETPRPARAEPEAAPPPEERPAATEQASDASGGASDAPESPRETANPSGALTGGDVVIQVFSSSDQSKAQEILDRLKANDFRAFISPVTDDGRTLYRVRVGPFEHQDDAERVAADLRRRLDLDTWITR